MIEDYGLSRIDIAGITLLDSMVVTVVSEGYTTPEEVSVTLFKIVQKRFNKIFNEVSNVDLDESIRKSFGKLQKKGFITEDGVLTEKGVKFIKFLKNETDLYDEVVQNLPKKVKEKNIKKMEPKIRIYDDEIKVEKMDDEIFIAPVHTLEHYFTTHPEKFFEFLDFLMKYTKNQFMNVKDVND